MPKRPNTQPEINEFRRESLKRAALKVIATRGYDNATVDRIAAAAGVSRGLINHYYEAKDDLLVQAYASLLERVTAETRKAALKHQGAIQQIFAMIETLFGPKILNQTSRDAYLAYWGATPTNAQFRKVVRQYYTGYHRAMSALIARAGQESGLSVDAGRLATSLTGLIDGMWLQLSLGILGVTPEAAVEICKDHLLAQLGAGRSAPPERHRRETREAGSTEALEPQMRAFPGAG